MPCVLHVELAEGARALADRLSIEPYKLAERGDPIRSRPGHRYEAASLSFDVSDADFGDLGGQFADATTFLREHEADVRALSAAGSAVLDFGYGIRPWPDGTVPFVQCDRLPRELVRLAAALDVEIELSLYPDMSEEPEEAPCAV